MVIADCPVRIDSSLADSDIVKGIWLPKKMNVITQNPYLYRQVFKKTIVRVFWLVFTLCNKMKNMPMVAVVRFVRFYGNDSTARDKN